MHNLYPRTLAEVTILFARMFPLSVSRLSSHLLSLGDRNNIHITEELACACACACACAEKQYCSTFIFLFSSSAPSKFLLNVFFISTESTAYLFHRTFEYYAPINSRTKTIVISTINRFQSSNL